MRRGLARVRQPAEEDLPDDDAHQRGQAAGKESPGDLLPDFFPEGFRYLGLPTGLHVGGKMRAFVGGGLTLANSTCGGRCDWFK